GVTAVRVGRPGHELRTVRLHEGDVRTCVLRPGRRRMATVERPAPPDVLPALVDRVRAGNRVGIADLRPVEGRPFAAAPERGGSDNPTLRVAVLEADIAGSTGELVRAPGRLGGVVDGIATVAVDDLVERVPVAVIEVRPRAVVLGSTHHLARLSGVDRDVDELNRAAHVLVDVGQLDRHSREQPLAADVVRAGYRTARDTVAADLVALRRDVGERAARADDAA